jgi:ParB family chromosome partitioning protein
MNPTQPGSFQSIALDAIRPSSTNPRKNFDPAALEELAQSIRENKGVAVPILVRPRKPFFVTHRDTFVRYVACINLAGKENLVETVSGGTEEENQELAEQYAAIRNQKEEGYEIVFGERRWLATKAAGLTEIRADVRDLTDAEAMDLQLVENLQRADLHPVEEAEGYRALMAAGASVEDVAKKAGKTTIHVQKLLRLMTLELSAKTIFHEGYIDLGHALILARLQPVEQDRAVRALLRAEGDYAKMPTLDVFAARKKNIATNDHAKHYRLVSMTVGQLTEWVSDNIMLSLDKVPWSLGDAKLIPDAGACTTCPKRTGSNPALFADMTAKEDVCTDAACFQAKGKQVQLVKIQAAAESGKPLLKLTTKSGHKELKGEITEKTVVRQGQWMKVPPGSCPDARKGILTDEPGRYDNELRKHKAGDVVNVCANQKCAIHKHTVEGTATKGGSSANSEQKIAAKKKAYMEAETPIRAAVVREILNKAEPGLYEVRSAIFHQISAYAYICREMQWEFEEGGSTWHSNQNAQPVVEAEIEKADIYVLGHLVLLDSLAHRLQPSEYLYDRRVDDRKRLWETADHYEVDADAIAEELEAEAQAAVKAEEPAKPGKTAKKKVTPAAQVDRKKAAAKKFPSKPKKLTLSPEGRKRIADAMKKRFEERQAKTSKSVDRKSAAAGERAEVQA